MIKINDIGAYSTLDELWATYPGGGKEGDFCTIGGKEYYWDIYRQRWILSEQETIISDARKTEEIDGNLIVYHNLTVGGKIRAKDVKSLNCGLFMSLEALKAAYPTPEVGMWAVVGDTMPGDLYRCDVAGEWLSTGGTGGVEVLDFERYEEFEQRIDKRVTTNTEDISGLRDDLSDLSTKVNINKSDISDLRKNVTSNTSEIGNINIKISSVEQDVQSNQSSILRLDSEKATREELQNSARGLSQAISSVGALAGSNTTRITNLEENVTTNTEDISNLKNDILRLDDEKATKQELANSAQGLGQAISNIGALAGNNSKDISDLKNNKANYTDIVDGTIVAAHALLSDNAASAETAKNAEFATEAGKAMQSEFSTLANAANTAYNVKATNIEGILTKEQLPVITQTVHIPITNSGLSPIGYSGITTLQETDSGNPLYVSIPVYITAPATVNELSGVANVFIIARCSSDTINAGDTIEIIKNTISANDREAEIIESGYYCFGYSVTDNNYDVTISRQVSILDLKQDTLVSGENIKTVNGKSLLGGGNIEIEGGSSGGGLSDSDRETINNLIELYEYTRLQAESNDFDTLPLLCGQPMILFGKGTPSVSVVPDNWKQYDIETGEGYNWNGLPSALGQQYINTSVTSGGRYIAVYSGYCTLKWVNF